MEFSKHDIALGALWRFASKRRLPKPAVVTLMQERCGMNARTAEQLATHWFNSKYFHEAA